MDHDYIISSDDNAKNTAPYIHRTHRRVTINDTKTSESMLKMHNLQGFIKIYVEPFHSIK